MAKGINISIASDTRQFQRGVKSGVVEPLEDAAEVLQDVERAGDDAGAALERSMSDAQRATDGLTDEYKDLQRKIEDSTRKSRDFGDAGRRAGREYEDGMDRAKGGVDDFRDEANSTAREAAASFDGSAESIGDAFQEVAANAFGGFGPAGAIAGLAAAAGIGLAVAGFEDVKEAQEEVNERASEWAQRYVEAGSIVMSAAQEVAAVQDVYTNQYQEMIDNADRWGVSHETAARAMIGSDSALAEARASVNAQLDEANALTEQYTDNMGNVSLVQEAANQGIRDADSALQGYEASAARSQEQIAGLSAFLRDYGVDLEGTSEKVDEFGDTVRTLPDGQQIYIDAETGQATIDVNQIEARIYGIPDGHATVYADTSPADRAVQAWAARTLTKYVNVQPVVPYGYRLVT